MAGETKFLANVFSQIVSHDIVVDGVTLARAGDRIILVPVTTYRAVMVGDSSLEDLWDTLSKEGHTHPAYQTALAGYQEQLTRFADRLTTVESRLEELVSYLGTQLGYQESTNAGTSA
jgi:hypothetical protein